MSLLKDYGLKETKQRLEIIELFNKYNSLTIKDIKNKTCNIDNSTIYRIIELFINKGILIMDVNGSQEISYALKMNHKHHLRCIKCHKVIEIDECPLENNKLLNGFVILDHHLDIDGICKNCQ